MSNTSLTLSQICRMDRRTLETSEAIKSGLKFVGMEQVDPDTGRIVTVNGSRTGDGKGLSFLFDSRHVLFGKLRPYLRKVALPDSDGCASTELVPLLPDSNHLDRGYLFHWLRQPRISAALMEKNTGARMPRADMSVLLAMALPLPPLEEQRRIVALLNRTAEIWRHADAARAKAREVISALFPDIFGDPATNPKGWPIAPLGRHLVHLTSGSRGWKRYYSDNGARFIRVQNVKPNALDLADVAHISPPDNAEAARTIIRPGDMVLTITGSPGIAAPISKLPAIYYVNQHVALVRTSQDLSAVYLSCFINHPRGGSAQFRVSAYGQTRPGLGLAEIRNLYVPVPPRSLQIVFAEQVQQIEDVAERLDAAAIKAASMVAALSAEVFENR